MPFKKPTPEKSREDFKVYVKGWDARKDGAECVAPGHLNLYDQRVWKNGWDGAHADLKREEREISDFSRALETAS